MIEKFSVGRVLVGYKTQMTAFQLNQTSLKEEKSIYFNFDYREEGKSRIFICECNNNIQAIRLTEWLNKLDLTIEDVLEVF